MILAIDVHYENSRGVAAGVAFEHWEAQTPTSTYISHIDGVSEYIPGQFFKRELPCILQLIREYSLTPATVVIDGYVYLDDKNKPGLGKYLYDELQGSASVIGVAKTAFTGISSENELYRGNSKRPLYITCEGEPLAEARKHIASMFGKHRIPFLLKQADQLSKHQS